MNEIPMDPVRYRVLYGARQCREFRSLAAALAFKGGLDDKNAVLQVFGVTGWADA